MNDQMTLRIPGQIEGLRPKTTPDHAVTVKGADVFQNGIQPFTIARGWITIGRREINDV